MYMEELTDYIIVGLIVRFIKYVSSDNIKKQEEYNKKVDKIISKL